MSDPSGLTLLLGSMGLCALVIGLAWYETRKR
jgi:hypothetical protein